MLRVKSLSATSLKSQIDRDCLRYEKCKKMRKLKKKLKTFGF